jgi:hypothetical protein
MLRRKRTPFSDISVKSGAVWYESRAGRPRERRRTMGNGMDVRGLASRLVSLEAAF